MSNSLNWISKFTRAWLKDCSAAMRTEETSSVSMGSSSSVFDSSCDKEGFQCEQEIKVYVQTKKLSKATDSDDTTSIYLSSYTRAVKVKVNLRKYHTWQKKVERRRSN